MILRKRKKERMGVKEVVREFPGHRSWVRKHECIIASKHQCDGGIEFAHVRKGTDGGGGLKPHDKWGVPMCHRGHALQHQIGEPAFEIKFGVDLKILAEEFAKNSPHKHKWENQ